MRRLVARCERELDRILPNAVASKAVEDVNTKAVFASTLILKHGHSILTAVSDSQLMLSEMLGQVAGYCC